MKVNSKKDAHQEEQTEDPQSPGQAHPQTDPQTESMMPTSQKRKSALDDDGDADAMDRDDIDASVAMKRVKSASPSP